MAATWSALEYHLVRQLSGERCPSGYGAWSELGAILYDHLGDEGFRRLLRELAKPPVAPTMAFDAKFEQHRIEDVYYALAKADRNNTVPPELVDALEEFTTRAFGIRSPLGRGRRPDPCWQRIEPKVFKWLDQNGVPSKLARVEKCVADLLAEEDEYHSEASVRDHATEFLEKYKKANNSA